MADITPLFPGDVASTLTPSHTDMHFHIRPVTKGGPVYTLTYTKTTTDGRQMMRNGKKNSNDW